MTELDLMRMTMIVGITLAAFIYQRTRLLSGGLMTGGYLGILITAGSWGDVLGWAVASVVCYLIVKTLTYLVALPKAWLLMFAIVSSALIHAGAVLISGGKGGQDPVFLGSMEVVIAGGMYLTPGLTAYDLARQGWIRTVGVVALIAGITAGVTFGISAIGNIAAPTLPLTNPVSLVYTDVSFPIVMLICIATAEAMRLTFGWGSGGIIGSVFFIELLSWESFFVIIGLTAVTVIAANLLKRYFIMTPRQWFQFTMILGAMVAWIGLSVGTYFGIEAAAVPGAYALEPLLAVGLISSDVARYGTWKTVAGKAIVLSTVFFTNLMIIQNDPDSVRWIGLIVAGIVIVYLIGFIYVRKGWLHARKVGEQFPLLPPIKV